MIASLSSNQASFCAAPFWQWEQVWHQFPHGSPSQAFETTHPSRHMCDIHLGRPRPGQTQPPENKVARFSSVPSSAVSCQQQHRDSLSHYLLKNSFHTGRGKWGGEHGPLHHVGSSTELVRRCQTWENRVIFPLILYSFRLTTIVVVCSMLHFFVEQIVYFSEEVFTTETVEIRLGLIMKNGELWCGNLHLALTYRFLLTPGSSPSRCKLGPQFASKNW